MNQLTRKKIAIETVGCRLNQYESERIVAQLAPYGFERATPREPANLYIINTCTVTHRADSSCRNLIRRAVRNNPNGRIVVVGCYVEAQPELISSMEGVDLVIDNKHKENIGRILRNKFPELFDGQPEKGCSDNIADFFGHNRAWIKVSDGCNQTCSYCLVTKVRGDLVNRPATDIIDEINSLVTNGYREVVLTGVNIGHYRDSQADPSVKDLAGLCRSILSSTEIDRIRISSIEPQTISGELINVYAEANGRICHHFHVPLQSGSPRILRRMHRPYTPEQFLKRLKAIKDAVPNTNIGADVIVGFPGESDEDFAMTRQVVETGLIDYLHVFSYSDRKGTVAAEMPEKINPEVIKERNAVLSRVSNRLLERAHRLQIGKVLDVISEHKPNEFGAFSGVSGNYVRVKLPGHTDRGKDIVKVKVTVANSDFVEGDIVVAD